MEMFNYGNFIKKIVEKAYLEMTRLISQYQRKGYRF